MDPRQPHEFPRRILLAVTGLSPQVVTETLYALCVAAPEPQFRPTEVHLLTTAEGGERARLQLLGEDPGWFRRFAAEHGVNGIRFDEDCITTLTDANGVPLEDIRTPQDNERAADAITEAVRGLTADPDCAVHASVAGGRKTLGFYLGYALSLFGRPQDRLSHVLVSAPFESHPLFFYPSPERRVIYDRENRPLDASEARVALAEIPFVRLRHGIPERLQSGEATFSETVAAAQAHFGPPSLSFELATARVHAGSAAVPMPPKSMAFYAWLADRRRHGMPALHWTDTDTGPFLALYRQVVGELSADLERAGEALHAGMTKEYFEQAKSRVNSALRKALGPAAAPYLITAFGRRPKTRFGLSLEPGQIHFQAIG